MSKDAQEQTVVALERIGKVLGAIYTSTTTIDKLDLPAKAKRLSFCGFSNKEIAAILGTTSNSINVALHRSRKNKTHRSKKKNKK